ncbi:hypothetical protein OXPF_04830 [Oxobacter pfennigii]|uniref:DUF4363 domain-containing protein n=1 Tax=Oxobacter pfennigii TaxID=36849 RepID=A0A0P9AL09_9CLOT|nr:DUF4363 family protein [Oxobacter pfennigii]KPU46003.1 hypothetical protein OXPF_04830 [Oxobacter pfennigii]
MKKYISLLIVLGIFLLLCACGPIRRPMDNKTGFSSYLKEAENHIRTEDWQNARASLESADKAWKSIKPILQIDIDHDYVNSIENNFTQLRAYIENKEKSDSLALILMIQEDWKNIGSM